jgi:hypothetical protein
MNKASIKPNFFLDGLASTLLSEDLVSANGLVADFLSFVSKLGFTGAEVVFLSVSVLALATGLGLTAAGFAVLTAFAAPGFATGFAALIPLLAGLATGLIGPFGVIGPVGFFGILILLKFYKTDYTVEINNIKSVFLILCQHIG